MEQQISVVVMYWCCVGEATAGVHVAHMVPVHVDLQHSHHSHDGASGRGRAAAAEGWHEATSLQAHTKQGYNNNLPQL